MARRATAGDKHLLQRPSVPFRFCVAVDGALLALPADVRGGAEERRPDAPSVALLQRHRQRTNRARRATIVATSDDTTSACLVQFRPPVARFFRLQYQVCFFPNRPTWQLKSRRISSWHGHINIHTLQ